MPKTTVFIRFSNVKKETFTSPSEVLFPFFFLSFLALASCGDGDTCSSFVKSYPFLMGYVLGFYFNSKCMGFHITCNYNCEHAAIRQICDKMCPRVPSQVWDQGKLLKIRWSFLFLQRSICLTLPATMFISTDQNKAHEPHKRVHA